MHLFNYSVYSDKKLFIRHLVAFLFFFPSSSNESVFFLLSDKIFAKKIGQLKAQIESFISKFYWFNQSLQIKKNIKMIPFSWQLKQESFAT